MDKTELCQSLMDCPDQILKLRCSAQETVDLINEVQRELKDLECRLLLDEYEPINGKNEQIRAAQLHERTQPERLRLEELQRVLAQREMQVELAENQFEAYLAISRLMAPNR